MEGTRSGGGSGSAGMPVSEWQADERRKFRVGWNALIDVINGRANHVIRCYVDDIVLHESDPEAVGRRLSGRAQAQQARAVAIEFLKLGLDRLACAYGLEPREAPVRRMSRDARPGTERRSAARRKAVT
jgi:hypothetical protein